MLGRPGDGGKLLGGLSRQPRQAGRHYHLSPLTRCKTRAC